MDYTVHGPTLCNTMDYTVHGILQARILESFISEMNDTSISWHFDYSLNLWNKLYMSIMYFTCYKLLDSIVENIIGCIALLLFRQVMSNSFATPWTVACQARVHGLFQSRILEWIVVSFSRGSSHPGIEPVTTALQSDSALLSHPGSPDELLAYS